MKKLTKKQRISMIGKKCRVSIIYTGKPKWNKTKIPERPGWVVGFGVIRRGKPEFLGYDEGILFEHEETIKVVKVRFWPTEKEQNVPFDALIIDESVTPFPSMAKYSGEYKKWYKKQIENFPRDEKGRFVKIYHDK